MCPRHEEAAGALEASVLRCRPGCLRAPSGRSRGAGGLRRRHPHARRRRAQGPRLALRPTAVGCRCWSPGRRTAGARMPPLPASSARPSREVTPWWSRTSAAATGRTAITSRTATRVGTATTPSSGPRAQPWSNGVVGTFGLSYPGAVQWLAAVEQPPSPQGDGARDDLRDPGKLLVFRRRLGRLVARLDLVEHRARPAAPARPHRAPQPSGGRRGMGARRWPRPPAPPDAQRCPTSRAWPPGTTSGCATRRAIPGGTGRRWKASTIGVGAAVLNLSGWFDEPYGPIGAVTNYHRPVGVTPGGPSRGPG